MKRYFFAGLLTILPVAITIVILVFLVDLLTAPFTGFIDWILFRFPSEYLDVERHRSILMFISRLLILFGLFLFTVLLGYIGKRIVFRWFLNLTNWVLLKLPVVRSIYRISREVSTNFFKENQDAFQKTRLVKFPHDKAWVLAFEGGPAPQESYEKLQKENGSLHSIFVPTSPHPISGYVCIMPTEDTRELTMTPEEVIKVLVSCGLYTADEKDKE